ncbi:MAG: hypothetical protein AAF648_16690 [Pseudomonadota bacterium]
MFRVLSVGRSIVLGLLVGAALTGPTGALASDLRERLGNERFAQFGLDKLSAAELSALAAWIDAGAVARPTPTEPDVASAEPDVESAVAEPRESSFGEEYLERNRFREGVGESITTRIKGPFTGWDGKTLFRLENGQIWRQRIGGRYRFRADSPEVEIEKGRFGYYLTILDTGRQIGVKRVR